MTTVARFLALYEEACQVYKSDASWGLKYDIIFPIVSRARGLFDFEWWDPDTSYQEDVQAVMRAFREKADDVRKLINNNPYDEWSEL